MNAITELVARALTVEELGARLADEHNDPVVRDFARRRIDLDDQAEKIESLQDDLQAKQEDLDDLVLSVRKAIKDSADRDSLVDALEELL